MSGRRGLLPEAPRPGLPALAGLRGLACLPVLLFHVSSSTPLTTRSGLFQQAFAPLGITAVMVFMWMSGYLILQPILVAHGEGRPTAPPVRFIIQRALRLYPVYWFVLVVAVVVIRVDTFTAGEWALMLSLVYVASGPMFYRGLIVSWTLAADMLFYLIVMACLPVLRWLAPPGSSRDVALRAQRQVLAGLVAIAATGTIVIFVADLGFGWDAGLVAGAPVIGLVIFTGSVMAYVVTHDRLSPTLRLLARTPWVSLLFAVGLLAVASTFDLPPGLVGQPEIVPLIGVLLIGAGIANTVCLPAVVDPDGTSAYHRFLGSNALRWLGEISFGVYLWQIPVLHVVETQVDLGVDDLWWAIPVTGLGTLALAIPTYLLVETPVRDAVRRRLGSRRTLARPPAPTLP
jgi:peptidoglycan/LPS O-acetylase OafA/YrhL